VVSLVSDEVKFLTKIYKLGIGNRFMKLDKCIKSSRWRIRLDFTWTAAQKRWHVEDGFNWQVEWRRVASNRRIPLKVRWWYLDVLNINLRIRYKRDVCKLCGEVVGSKHYRLGCKGGAQLRKRLQRLPLWGKLGGKLVLWWAVWICHCFRGEEGVYRTVRKVGRELENWRGLVG